MEFGIIYYTYSLSINWPETEVISKSDYRDEMFMGNHRTYLRLVERRFKIIKI